MYDIGIPPLSSKGIQARTSSPSMSATQTQQQRMATPNKTRCLICEKEKVSYKCPGCFEDFCYNHLGEHRQQVDKQFDELENKRNSFRQNLTEQTKNPENNFLIEQINKWEKDSIDIIKQTANQAKELLMKHTNQHINDIEIKLNKLTEELDQTRKENDFNEIHLKELEEKLKELEEKLKELEEKLHKPSNILIQQDTSLFIKKISVIISPESDFINYKWKQNAITVAGGNDKGNELNQLNYPYGLFIDDNESVYVADSWNHRIVEWKRGATSGQVVAGGNGPGHRNDQLNYPVDVIVDKEHDRLIISDCKNKRVVQWPRRNGKSGEIIISNVVCWGLTMDNDGYLYVSDNSKDEVRRWKMGDTNGVIVAGGNGKGNGLDQHNDPSYIFVDQDHSLYVSDYKNHRVMKWMKDRKEAIVVAGGQGEGNGLTQLSCPHGVIVDQLGTVYIADFNNHRVMCWLKGATQGNVVVGEIGGGTQSNQLNYPVDLSFDRENNLYVIDYSNHRVQKFDINLN